MPASSSVSLNGRRISRGRKKSILQSNPKYQSSSQSVNSDRRDDQFQQEFHEDDTPIPQQYIDTIIRGFGPHADIYRDVLQISPDASPRELRICYFRRGREVLTEAGLQGSEGFSSGNHIPDRAKTRFEAVSMSYEILCKPAWRDIYLREGLQSASPKSSDSVAQLGRPSVRWNEQVEELLYERVPEEIRVQSANKKKKKNRKTRIVIEKGEEELDEHLAKFDAEAESHFVDDFFDSLEESLDGLLKFASSGKRLAKKVYVSDNVGGRSSPLPRTQSIDTDDDSLVGRLTSRFLSRPSSPPPPKFNPDAHVVPLSHSEAKEPVPFRCISPDPCQEGDDEPFDVESVASSVSSSKRNANLDVPEDEDIFDGVDEGLLHSQHKNPSWRRSPSPGNVSAVSDLSESVANPRAFTPISLQPDDDDNDDHQSTASSKKSRPVTPEPQRDLFKERPDLYQEGPDDEFFEDKWCRHVVRTLGECGNQETTQPANNPTITASTSTTTIRTKALADSSMAFSEKDDDLDDDNFLQFFVEYVQALMCQYDDSEINSSAMDCMDSTVGSFLIRDEELEQLLRIVENEVKKTPKLTHADAFQAPTLLLMDAANTFA